MKRGLNEVRKQRGRQETVGVCVCVFVCKVKRGKKQEERTGEELLMALLLSLSAHCDSQNQLLNKTTSLWRRRRRQYSGEVIRAREIRAEGWREETSRATM